MKEVFNFQVRPEKGYQKTSGVRLVEVGTYISAEKQIKAMLNAGIRLQMARREQYDFESENKIDHNFTDPTRNAGFDFADADEIVQGLERKKERIEADKITKQKLSKKNLGEQKSGIDKDLKKD